jgi:flagellar protein FliS
MATIAAQRARFATTAASTASPQALLVMLYDRLVLDLERADAAGALGDVAATHRSLVHAQDIVTELSLALEVDAWEGGPGLQALYAWLLTELVEANTAKDGERVRACLAAVVPLRDAWREAATATTATAGPPAALGGTA